MKKLLIILILLMPFFAGAQIFKMMTTPNQAIIKDAVNGGIFIVAQHYQLEDTVSGQRYGRNGGNNFGCSYSLGIKLNNKLCLNIDAIAPWEQDDNFNRYRGAYRPVCTETTYKELNDSTFSTLSIDYNCIDEIADSALYEITDTATFDGLGFECDSVAGQKEGWLVWLVADKPITSADSVMSTDMIITRYQLSASAQDRIHEVNKPSTVKHVWGGIFVVPQQTAIGQLTFRLCGIMQKTDNDNWQITTPFTNDLNRVFKQNKIKLIPDMTSDEDGDASIKELD